MKNSRVFLSLALAAMLMLAAHAKADLPPVAWTLQPDAPPASATSAPSAKINPQLKLNVPSSTKVSIINPTTKPLLLAMHYGVKVRDLLTNADRGGIGKEVEINGTPILSADGRYIAVIKGRWSDVNRAVQVYDARNGRMSLEIPIEGDPVPLMFLDATRFVVAIGPPRGVQEKKNFIKIFDATKQGPAITTMSMEEKPTVARLSPGGKYLAFTCSSGAIFFDVKSGEAVGVIGRGNAGAQDLAFSPDGSEVAILGNKSYAYNEKEAITVYGLTNGAETARFQVELPTYGMRSSSALECPIVQYFPDGKAWLIPPVGVIDRQTGTLVYDYNKYRPNGGWREMPLRWVISNDQTLSMDNSGGNYSRDMEIIVDQIPRQRVDKVLSALAEGGDVIDVDLPKETTTTGEVTAAQLKLPGPQVLEPDGQDDSKAGKSDFDPGERLNDKVATRANLTIEQVMRVRADLPQIILRYHVPSTSKVSKAGIAIERVDLISGQALGQLETKFPATIYDVSPDGTQALLAPGRAAKDRVDVYTLIGKAKPVVGWRPEALSGGEKALTWGGFLDNTRVLTLGASGRLVCWELPACKAVYAVDLSSLRNPHVALSTNRKHLAALGQSGFAILDTASGTTISSSPCMGPVGRVPMFSANGRIVAAADNNDRNARIHLFDITSGKPAASVMLPSLRSSEGRNYWTSATPEVQWLTKDHVLIGSQLIVDAKKAIAIWRINQDWNQRNVEGTCILGRYVHPVFAQNNRESGVIANTKVPPEEAVRMTAAFSRESVIALRPGQSLTVNLAGVPEESGKRVIQSIANLGYKIEAGKSNVLSFSVAVRNTGQGEVETRHRFGFSGTPTGETVTSREAVVTAVLTVEGKEVWRDADRVTTPSQWQRQEGESAQSIMDRELQNYTGSCAVRITDHFPELVFDQSLIGSASLRGGEGAHVVGNARPEQETGCVEALTKLIPQITKLQETAAATITGAENKSLDIKGYQMKVGELERLRAAFPPIEDMDQLLPAETESYRKILDTSNSAIKSLRAAANVFNARASGAASGPNKAQEFLTKASGQFNGTIKSEATWLQKRLDELKAKVAAPK